MKKLILTGLIAGGCLQSQAQTVKKVLLEDFTGKWCQFCPNGTNGIDEMEVTYPANFLPAAVHNDNSAALAGPNDPLEIAEGEFLATSAGLGSKGFPSGAVDRKFFPTIDTTTSTMRLGINSTASQWKTAVGMQTASTAIVSVSFANFKQMTDGTYEADVNVKFESAPASGVPVVLQVYVLEDSIEATGSLAQINSTTHYGGGNPLTSSGNNFWHNHTLRAALGGNWGYSISSPVVGQVWTKHITITIPATGIPQAWQKDQIHLYAFVAYNGTTKNQKEVLNAEEISLKAFHKVSVGELSKGVSILNAYPNPAKTTDVVKVTYNIANNEVVTMNVFNMMGQQVAQPYVSNEVKGGHTIHWRPADNGLAPGMYLVEVSSASGKQVQRINIQ